MYRQGDILIIPVSETELSKLEKHDDTKPIPRDNGRIVLAYGETTGHAHAIGDTGVELLSTRDGRFLRASTSFTLSHEEHAAISIPAGTFRVVRQREYSPNSGHFTRTIAD